MTSGVRPKLVASAIDLVRRHGVSGTGIAQLLEHSGVARRSIYLNFPGGKSELIAAATDTAGQGIAAMMEDQLATAGIEHGLDVFVQWWKDILIDSDYSAGCPVAAAALGRSEAEAASDIAGAVFQRWEALIAAALADRAVPPRTAESLAAMAIASIEGAVIICIAERDTAALDQIRKHIAELIDLHLVEAG